MSLDSTTIIAGVLGVFFLIIAMAKSLGRKKTSQLYIPGTSKPQDDSEEVKLSDPFSSPKAPAAGRTAERPGEKTASPASGKVENSAFKQFAPDSSTISEVRARNDSDYQWE